METTLATQAQTQATADKNSDLELRVWIHYEGLTVPIALKRSDETSMMIEKSLKKLGFRHQEPEDYQCIYPLPLPGGYKWIVEDAEMLKDGDLLFLYC